MRKSEVEVGAVYTAKISGVLTEVRILGDAKYGNGWRGLNLRSGREIRIKSAQKLRKKVSDGSNEEPKKEEKMMEEAEKFKAEADERFSKPASASEAAEMWTPPDRGPNVATIYEEAAVKKLLSAVVTKKVREELSKLHVEKAGRTKTAAPALLETMLADKKVLRGDGEPWTASQLKSVLEAFGWVATAKKRRASSSRKASAPKLSPAEIRARQYKLQLGLLEGEMEEAEGDTLEALQSEYRIELKAVEELRKAVREIQVEIKQAQDLISELRTKEEKVDRFIEKREAALNSLSARILEMGGKTETVEEQVSAQMDDEDE